MSEAGSRIQSRVVNTGSLAATFSSSAVEIGIHPWVCGQVVWSAGATPVGNMDLQESNDGTNWANIAGATAAISGASGSSMLNPTSVVSRSRYVRFTYTRTSGSGTVDCYLSAKQG